MGHRHASITGGVSLNNVKHIADVVDWLYSKEFVKNNLSQAEELFGITVEEPERLVGILNDAYTYVITGKRKKAETPAQAGTDEPDAVPSKQVADVLPFKPKGVADEHGITDDAAI